MYQNSPKNILFYINKLKIYVIILKSENLKKNITIKNIKNYIFKKKKKMTRN